MKNEDAVYDIVSGIASSKTENIFGRKENGVIVIYSYGEHFPMAMIFADKKAIANQSKYSVSTSRHQTLLYRSLSRAGIKIEKWVDTNELQKLVNMAFRSEDWINSYNEMLVGLV
jgi:hypothetical protein